MSKKHWSDGMNRSALMEKTEQDRLDYRRRLSRHRREEEVYRKVRHGSLRYVTKLTPIVQRLIDNGTIIAIEQFFPRLGIGPCWRLEDNWLRRYYAAQEEPKKSSRVLDLGPCNGLQNPPS
jgi:hypothetical protein